MKKGIAFLLILTLAVSLAACGAPNGPAADPSEQQTETASKSGAADAASNGNEIVIGGKTVKLTYESHHGDLYFKENVADIEKSSYDQFCNLYCPGDEGTLFIIHIVYFEGKDADEVMSGSESDLTDKTVNGVTYRYFEYDENGVPGHTYVYTFEGTTYTISFVSNYDMTVLESVFLSNVRFAKE